LECLPSLLRDANWDVTVTLWNNQRIIAIEQGNSESAKYGFSVDIGTSTIVGYLVDLNSGNIVSTQSQENPQVIYGEDIISRISFASKTEGGLAKLQDTVIDAINGLISNACQDQGISPDSIYEVTVVGNTAMHHLFLGIQPKSLSVAPYVPVVKRSMNLRADSLRVKVNPLANIHVLPIIAGFVGADAIADVLATGIHTTQKMSLLIDVGTNGEVFVGNKEDIVSCSCAAGPAFEGMQIRNGMKARTGAIEKVKLEQDTFEVKYETIGGVKPVGICGSGMVDAIAEMFKYGITSQRGGINREIKTKRLIEIKGQPHFVIAWKYETGIGNDITINGKDIQEIQLAKAAFQTGTTILMKEKAVTANELDQVYLAGAFGRYINQESAKIIGLIPDVPTKRIRFVGNTAVSGAKMALTSTTIRKQAEKLAKEIRYVELVTAPNFQEEYQNSIFLPHRKVSRNPTS
ncbi:MAG: ASKHA domain-containing protein, partial [Candidatus Hermodarchaeia archaeon]